MNDEYKHIKNRSGVKSVVDFKPKQSPIIIQPPSDAKSSRKWFYVGCLCAVIILSLICIVCNN